MSNEQVTMPPDDVFRVLMRKNLALHTLEFRDCGPNSYAEKLDRLASLYGAVAEDRNDPL